MSLWPASLAWAPLLALGLAGCAGEDASARVVVGLTTDLAVGFDVRRVETTLSVDGAVVQAETLSYTSGDLVLPGELVLPPAPDGAELALRVEAFAGGAAGPVVTRTVETRAAGGRTLLLPVSLDAACAGAPCAAGATCVGGACVDPFLAPSTLPEYDARWITSAPDACKTPSSGDPPLLVLGQGNSAFAPLGDDEVVSIEPGPQGGHHVWLALRVRGLRQMGSRLTLRGSFPALAAELPSVTSIVTLRKAAESDCEIHGVRFQVDHGLPLEAVQGQSLDIELTLEDPDGDVATAMKRVVIAPPETN